MLQGKKNGTSKMIMRINVKGSRGRPNKRWLNTIENNLKRALGVCVGGVEYRNKWPKRVQEV